jgi:hypothetical protein
VTVIVSASSAFKDSPTIFEPVENNLPFLDMVIKLSHSRNNYGIRKSIFTSKFK